MKLKKVKSDPFYDPRNLAYLRKSFEDYKAGRNFSEHELIETTDDKTGDEILTTNYTNRKPG